ncbi:MAG: hypothetical protein H6729_04305 [Deltaproteobacteria bacterium]|nr:hypothetical protein [Deltaproteobacteria bacterium]
MSHSDLTLDIGIPESWIDLSAGSGCFYRDPASSLTLAVELIEGLGLRPERILSRQTEGISELDVGANVIMSAPIACRFGDAHMAVHQITVGETSIRQLLLCAVRDDDVALVATASAPASDFAACRAYLLDVLRNIDLATWAASDETDLAPSQGATVASIFSARSGR